MEPGKAPDNILPPQSARVKMPEEAVVFGGSDTLCLDFDLEAVLLESFEIVE